MTELTLGKKKKALTYYSLVLYDSNSSFTFYTWILILQPFLLMFQAYVFTISLSVNHTVLLIIHNLSPSQCSACRFSIPIFSPSSYPAWEEIFISQKWNRDGSDTSLGLAHCFFWLMLYNVICPNKNFHSSFLYTDVNQTLRYLWLLTKSNRYKYAVPIVFAI